ncbi:DUF2958 domain-containing protein [Desulfospira joergensenii]|uniref:DUF2958 domain-containing protein n=1 Tax=Desulfospira joergensenii TaxID=53329 RepID=UPI0003B4A3AB|nr:DUF2958 domain-containing protein [Desulfospira joergensenii]
MMITNEHLKGIPGLYQAEGVKAKDKIIYLHMCLGACHWYAAEYDPKARIFYGFAVFNDDFINAQWGFFSLNELRGLRLRKYLEVEVNPNFEPRPAGEIETIKDLI